MANFRTHVTVSSLCGVGFAALGAVTLDLPLESCILAGGLCGLAGMLPDLDSNNSVPLREILAFSAAIMPLLMAERFESLGLSHTGITLAGACVYLLVRFGVGSLLKKCTVHRGMFHSLPAALIAGLAAFLICDGIDPHLRVFKAGAVFVGFVSHLILDEFYSVERGEGKLRLKKSFGTALKLTAGNHGGTSAAYGMLLLLIVLAVGDTLVFHSAMISELPPMPVVVDDGATVRR